MIVLGGDFTDAAQNTIGGCNPDYPPIKLLDLSTYSWQTQYPLANATYEVPALVYNVIGGGPNGGATLNAPTGGFNATIGNNAASVIFSKRVIRSTASLSQKELWQNTKILSTNTAIPTPPPQAVSASRPVNRTAALIGAVIGGIALILGLGGALLVLRRKRAAKSQGGEDLTWQKAELPDHPPSPNWAEKRPGGFRTHEMFGDEPGAMKPRELLGDLKTSTSHKMRDSTPHDHNESDVSKSFPSMLGKELPPLPVELPTGLDGR